MEKQFPFCFGNVFIKPKNFSVRSLGYAIPPDSVLWDELDQRVRHVLWSSERNFRHYCRGQNGNRNVRLLDPL